MKRYYACLIFALTLPFANSWGGCLGSQRSVTVTIQSSFHAFGIYWQLVPDSNLCGVNSIYAGGNLTQLDCNSAGINVATPGNGYFNQTTVTEGPWCLDMDSIYSIRYVEDNGTYPNRFTVNINGYPLYDFVTSGTSGLFSFKVKDPLAYNTGVTQLNFTSYENNGLQNISGTLYNYSSNTLTDITLNYSINGGTPVSQTISGLTIAPFTEYSFVHPTQWNAVNGNYEIKIWCQLLNGNVDMDNSNDTLSKSLVIGDSIPNIIDSYLTSLLTYTTIGDASDFVYFPSDLDFHTVLSKNELWVLNMGDTLLDGSTVTFYNAGTQNQVSLWRQDSHAHHFMYMPAAIAFNDNTNFATADAVLDAHHNAGRFAGPALWNSDSLVYARPSAGPLGSHIDMIHQSPFAMGVEAEHENAYWVYDGYNQRITRYDFVTPHAPGEDEHSDGLVKRYDDIVLQRINDTIPNHLVLDKSTGWLYVVDNGNGRVVRMDINTGSVTGNFANYGEQLTEHSIVTGTNWSNYITTGLVQPAGIDLIGNRLIISDYSNGDIIIYNCSGLTGVELGRINTGSPGVAGVKIGPDGRIWYVNQLNNTVKRVDTILSVGTNDKSDTDDVLYVYPNPADDGFTVNSLQFAAGSLQTLKVFDVMGKVIYNYLISISALGHTEQSRSIQTSDWQDGVYFIQLTTSNGIANAKVVVRH